MLYESSRRKMVSVIEAETDVERYLRGCSALPSQLAIKTSFSPSQGDIKLLLHPKLEYLKLSFAEETTDNPDSWWATHLLRNTNLLALSKMCMVYDNSFDGFPPSLPRSFPKLCFSSALCLTLKTLKFHSLHHLEKECVLLGRALPSLTNLNNLTFSSCHFDGHLGCIITAVFGVAEFFCGGWICSHEGSLVVLNSISERFSRTMCGKGIFVVFGQGDAFEIPHLKLLAAAVEKCPATKTRQSCLKKLFGQDNGFLQALQHIFD